MHSQFRNDCFHRANGVLTERLGNGLQNRVERFDSARHLHQKEKFKSMNFSFFCMISPSFICFTSPFADFSDRSCTKLKKTRKLFRFYSFI